MSLASKNALKEQKVNAVSPSTVSENQNWEMYYVSNPITVSSNDADLTMNAEKS